jgi:hypothetical protein
VDEMTKALKTLPPHRCVIHAWTVATTKKNCVGVWTVEHAKVQKKCMAINPQGPQHSLVCKCPTEQSNIYVVVLQTTTTTTTLGKGV